MKLILLLMAVMAALVSAKKAAMPQSDPSWDAVAFVLNMDYAVASVWSPNRSFADVARVEGGPSYRQKMRQLVPSSQNKDLLQSSHDHLATNGSIYNYMPAWLGGATPPPHSFTPMLKSLKTATEAYVEHEVRDANIVLPFWLEEGEGESLREAASAVSITTPRWRRTNAEYAALANGFPSDCPDDYRPYLRPSPPECWNGQMLLALDYSNAALSATLLIDENETLNTLNGRTFFNPALGHTALYQRCPQLGMQEECIAEVLQALRNITTLSIHDFHDVEMEEVIGQDPYGTYEKSGIKHVSRVLTYGDPGMDPILSRALQHLRQKQDYDTMMVRFSLGPRDFEAARGAAESFWHYHEGISFGCTDGWTKGGP